MLEIADTAVDLSVEDVEVYLGAREVAAAVDAPGVMEYWKSTPYLLSFMDNYRLSDRLKATVETESNGAAAQLVSRGTGLQVDRRAMEERRDIGGGNGRMRELLSDLEDGHLYELLWLPPSLPLYTLGSDFERARSSTKRLVFSSWTMVPRAIAAMGSYAAERRYVPDAERARRYEAQLLGIAVNSYSLFSLLTPSSALADAGDPLHYAPGDAPGLLSAVRERLRPEVEELTRDAPVEGAPQEIWYAVAPLLLSGESPASLQWLHGPPAIGGDDEAGESTLWQTLAARVRSGLADPSTLGRPPRDLLDVMAAHAFRSLFRTPAAEGLLRNVYVPGVPGGERQYWRRVLAYALEGGGERHRAGPSCARARRAPQPVADGLRSCRRRVRPRRRSCSPLGLHRGYSPHPASLTGPANVARRGASGRTSTVAGGVSHGVRPAPSGRPHGVHPAGDARRAYGEPRLCSDGGSEPSRVNPARVHSAPNARVKKPTLP